MVGSRWQYPLVLITGIAIIFICLFNMVIYSLNLGYPVNIYTPEMIILFGMFIFTTSGSSEILTKMAIWILSKIPEKPQENTSLSKEKDVKKVNSSTGIIL